MMHDDDDRLDDALIRALRELDEPPPAPREEMWARIAARRAESAGPGVADSQTSHSGDVVPLRPRRNPFLAWGAALAAMLVLGIGLGRMTAPADAPAGTTAAATDAAPAEDAVPVPYQVAASLHLQRTETLLASLAVDSRADGTAEVSAWARELLTDTRLLLSSPAAADPAMARLLEDLELLLSQIAMIPADRAEDEVELIQNGLNQSDVLLRLRAATAGPRSVGT